MTEINSVLTRLLSGIEEHVAELGDIELYLFGSSTGGKAFPSDVDLLLVYADGDLLRGHDLAETIRELPVGEIYDVLVLSDSEERELEFIESEHAIRIWPIAV
ncbi:nucleotidyltransferase domain-containing protein [Streptosporangium sp. NPDC004631]